MAVYQQARRWFDAGVLDDKIHDLRALLRLAEGQDENPSAAVIGSRTVRSTPVSGERATYDSAWKRKESKIDAVVDTRGHLLILHVCPASENDGDDFAEMAESISDVTDGTVEIG